MRKNYRHTLFASYVGYVVQAIMINLPPLLFLTFRKTYGISVSQISLLIAVNFTVQLIVDMLSSYIVNRLGYRISVIAAHISATLGLICLAMLPQMTPSPYTGLIVSMVLCGVGGGLIEVLISPIVEACPTESSAAAMSLLHSFYSWGQAAVILLSTLMFYLFGMDGWRTVLYVWAAIPIANAVYFYFVPIRHLPDEGTRRSLSLLFKSKMFYVFALMMLCAGAGEMIMCQWASSFAESGLHISKAAGDLLGPCCFALLMGVSRTIYSGYSAKINLKLFMLVSCVLCIFSYLLAIFSPIPLAALIGCALCGLSVGVMWPGTYSISAKKFPNGGVMMFSMLALSGDIGCVVGPSVAGEISSAFGNDIRYGFMFALIFPIIMIAILAAAFRNPDFTMLG